MSQPSAARGEPALPFTHAGPVDLALAPALRLRLLGTGVAAIGVVVAVGVALGALSAIPGAIVGGLVLLATAGVLTLGALVGVRHWVLRLDAHGYRVRAIRTAGVKAARWADVLDLQTTYVSGARCVVLRLRDGRTTTLPVDVIEGSATALAEQIASHLDRGTGYRRLR